MFACLYLPGAASASPLVALAQDFSPRFEVMSTSAVLIDVDGLDRLVGDADAVGAALTRLARQRGLAVRPALAPTRTAAMLLALAGHAAAGSEPCSPRGAGRPAQGRPNSAEDSGAAPSRAGGARRQTYSALVRPGAVAAALAPLPLTLLPALHDLEHEHPASVGAAPPTPASRRGGRGARTRGSGRNYRLAPGPHAAGSPAPQPSPRLRQGLRQEEEGEALVRDLVETLHRWGLHTLGAFAALPSVDLFERLGTAGLAWQGVARGEDVRPLVRTRLEEPFEATAALEWPVDTLEPLSFIVSGLLEPLCARLARAERGVAELQTTLQLVNRTLHVRRLELPAPMRDVKVLRTLVLLDLESHPPDAGVDRVTLTLAPTPERIVQHSLLMRARPSPEQVATLAARLMAVLGDTRVGAPALVDSYAPGAFTLRPFDGDVTDRSPDNPTEGGLSGTGFNPVPARPFAGFVLRRFRDRVPARVERAHGRPVRVSVASPVVRGGRVIQAAGPWRTSGAWWELGDTAAMRTPGEGAREPEAGSREPEAGNREPGAGSREPNPAPWDRDEWDVVIADGAVLRLSRDRDSGAWFVDGVLD